MEKVTIITPTTGKTTLAANIRSVHKLGKDVKHWIVVDGMQHFPAVHKIIDKMHNEGLDLAQLRFTVIEDNTGGDGYYGHRIYASFGLLCNTQYVAMLDEDCTVEPNWGKILSIDTDKDIITCRRNIIYDGAFIGTDNVESIGQNKFGYYLYDINTYLVRQDSWAELVPILYGKWGVDRELAMKMFTRIFHIPDALVNYTVREDRIKFYRKLL